jgi:SAM (Sterile alpha motif) domain-containing protein
MDIAAWLGGLGLEQYAPAFRDNDVDGEVLPELTADDLISMGVTSVGHRRKLLAAIAALRSDAPPVAARIAPATAVSADAERRQLTVMFCDLVQLTDLETAERVLTRVGKTPPGRRLRSASAAEAKAAIATRGRGRPPRAAESKLAGRKPSVQSSGLSERVLALATGKTRQELYAACPSDRPNHIGMAVQRHIRAGRIQERDGKLYATSTATEQARATA